MFDPRTVEILATLTASFALLGAWVGAALVLPWSDEELDEVAQSFAGLREALRPQPLPTIAREVVPR